jgi:F-type H+-transporting ATPase subunit b
MDETLRQLGGLLLGAVPTIILFLLVYGAYRSLVHKPLQRVLDERRSKTEGAIEKARADVAAAEAKTAEYEERLREARVSVFKAQEARRQQALQAKSAVIAEARGRAELQVREARTALDRDMTAAKTGLQAEAERLANEIIRSVLKTAVAAQNLAGGAQ